VEVFASLIGWHDSIEIELFEGIRSTLCETKSAGAQIRTLKLRIDLSLPGR
jgi:hypothetical protein